MRTKWYEPEERHRASFEEWRAALPEDLRKVAERFHPWTLYRLKSTGHYVAFHMINGPNDISPSMGKITVQVSIPVEANRGRVTENRIVFGVDPDDLEEIEALPEGDA
jgi:hypothetical protein